MNNDKFMARRRLQREGWLTVERYWKPGKYRGDTQAKNFFLTKPFAFDITRP